MTRRTILTDRQRAALFDLPTDEGLLLRHYMLADDDLATGIAADFARRAPGRTAVGAFAKDLVVKR